MNQDFETSQSPLRAERARPQTANGHIRGVEATASGLIRSTVIASGAAAAILAVVYLPAEYGIDPTGFGAVLGLTEMGQIKQQLYAEDAADAASTPVVLDPAVIARLDRMEAQLASISAAMATRGASTQAPAQAEPEANAEAEESQAAAQTQAPVAEAAPLWRDEASYTLDPGEGIEVKLVMEEGQIARFEWTANGSVVNYDTHGDGSGQKISYEQGRAVPEQTGELTAAFTGNHGWFWRNRTDTPVTLTLRTAGEYSEVKAP